MTLTTEKICSGVKYSTLVSTDDARQAFQERFPLVRKLKVKHRKYYYFAHAVYGERKLFCHAYKSWEALFVRVCRGVRGQSVIGRCTMRMNFRDKTKDGKL